MKSFIKLGVVLVALASCASAHYTFPSLVVNGVTTPAWENVRKTNNFNSQSPVTDVTSADIRCYDSAEPGTASTIQAEAGSTIQYLSDGTMYHPSVVNVYMAKAPEDVDGWAGDGAVWFKVYEMSAVTDGGKSITFPAENLPGVTFKLPSALPSGQYLIRVENIAIHSASSYGGAQFYLSCAQVEITNGGNGAPGPLVAFPGAYTGYEPGILINIYSPVPKNYTQPGPAVWTG